MANPSFMNVENVVNPPQSPVTRNNLRPSLGECFIIIPLKMPRRTQPDKFAASVPNGN